MSPLPGWRLVWSLYGRFWCRSSLEVLSVAHGRAGMWSRAMWRGQPSLTSRALAANSSHNRRNAPIKAGSLCLRQSFGGLWMAV